MPPARSGSADDGGVPSRTWWLLDGLEHGHTISETLWYLAKEAEATDEQGLGVATTAGLDLGRRWPRWLGRLLGGR